MSTRINKPIDKVFDAVVDPDKIGSYFVPGGVTGPMVQGAEITWTFPDVSCVQAMKVVRLEKNKEVELDWFKDDGSKTHVLIKFEKLGDNETMVSIKHSGHKPDETGLQDSYSHCEGWSVMLSSLKVFLEYGINLGIGYW